MKRTTRWFSVIPLDAYPAFGAPARMPMDLPWRMP